MSHRQLIIKGPDTEFLHIQPPSIWDNKAQKAKPSMSEKETLNESQALALKRNDNMIPVGDKSVSAIHVRRIQKRSCVV